MYGVGIGALVGSGIGLTLGIVDVTQDKPGRTRYVLRDMLYGEGFGATVGAIAGGLTAISTKKPEHILLGASIGVLSGAVLGAVFGFIEGRHASARQQRLPCRSCQSSRRAASLPTFRLSRGATRGIAEAYEGGIVESGRSALAG